MSLIKSNINYSGPALEEIYREVINDTGLIQWGASVKQGFKDKYNFHRANATSQPRDYACRTTTKNNLNLKQVSGDMCRVEDAWDACHDDLVGTYREQLLRAGVMNEKFTDDSVLINLLTADMVERFANGLDYLAINGADDYYGEVSCTNVGLIPKLKEVGSGALLDPSPADITASNVLDKLKTVYELYPARIKHSSRGARPKFMLSPDVWDAWVEVLNNPTQSSGTGTAGTFTAFDPTKPGVASYRGIEIGVVVNLPDSSIILTKPDNIAVFTDATSDWNQLRIVDLSLTTLDDVVEFKVAAAFAVDVAIYTEVAAHLR